MTYFLLKSLLSGIIIATVSEVARRYPALGAFIVSLPLISILAVLWLWRDTGDAETIARHLEATFWLVLPTLPMFLLIPWLLRHGVGFWAALLSGGALTLALYGLTLMIAARLKAG